MTKRNRKEKNRKKMGKETIKMLQKKGLYKKKI